MIKRLEGVKLLNDLALSNPEHWRFVNNHLRQTKREAVAHCLHVLQNTIDKKPLNESTSSPDSYSYDGTKKLERPIR